MSIFLKAKKTGSIPAAIFFSIFLTLLSLLGAVFLSVGVGNPINKVTHNLWTSQTFRIDAGKYFVSKALETATGDERKLLLQKGPAISATVTNFLANPIFHQEIDQISNVVYGYYSSGSKTKQTIDVSPVANLGLLGLESVDPQFSTLKKELDKIKPIKLQPQKNGPNVDKVKSGLKLLIILLLLLSLLMLFLYSLFASSLKSFLRRIGITFIAEGIFLIALDIVASAIIKHQASTSSESLAREAIPIAAHPLLAPFVTIGILELLLGILLFIPSFLKRMNVSSQG